MLTILGGQATLGKEARGEEKSWNCYSSGGLKKYRSLFVLGGKKLWKEEVERVREGGKGTGRLKLKQQWIWRPTI